MSFRPRPLSVGAALLGLLPGALTAQAKWVGHEDPCDLSTGHYLVRGAIVYLQQAVETRFPDQRGERLAEAHRVLTDAVTTAGLESDPAAWYYFGRYYVETNDAAGADSAFRNVEEMVPSCAADLAQYRRKVGPLALNEAMRAWGERQPDSAAAFFRLARGLMPGNAEVPLQYATMAATVGWLDTAETWARRGLEEAGDDTAFAARRRETLLEIARAREAVAYQDQTVIRGPQARITRDTIGEHMARDSSILADMVGRVAEIRGAGRQLDPQSLQAFEQESTAVAGRLDTRRAVRDSVARLAAADSQAAAVVLDPAIRAFRTFVDAYPAEGDAVMKLARLYSAAGHRAALDALIARVGSGDVVSTVDMVQGALTLSNEGQTGPARRLLVAALARNPYDYNALFVLARVLYAARDVDALEPVARQLVGLDPLSQNTMRTLAMAWDLRGQRDSVTHYVALADTGIGWNVNVTQFTPRDSSTVLTGAVVNVGRRALPAITLVFDFLDAGGTALFSETVAVPALEPRNRERISLRLDRGGAVAWRYRRQDD